METFSVTTIFWLLVIGVTTGWALGYILGDEGISVKGNMIWGTAGAVIIGVCGLYVNLSGVLLFAWMGTLATLFLVNVFHHHHDEDLPDGHNQRIHILKKSKL